MKPQITIIICTRNRACSLESTLKSIGKATVPIDWDVDLLVVDNGSTDSTEATVASTTLDNLAIRYVQEPRAGKGYAYNTGIAAARGRIFLFTDDDVRVPIDWIEGMCRPIVEGVAEAVQGGIKIAPHLDRPWLVGALRAWLAAVEKQQPDGLVGANMSFGREAIKITGGFDTRLGPGAAGFYDDTMFGLALEKAGGRIIFQPGISVEHHFAPERLELSSFIRTAQRLAASRAIVVHTLDPAILRPSLYELLREIPGLGFRCVTQGVRFLTKRRPDPGFLVRYYRVCFWIALRKGSR